MNKISTPPPPPYIKPAATETPSKVRKSNFELLRILAMFLIVMNHSILHGLRMELEVSTNFNTLLINSFRNFGSIGNILFMLIAGYFLTGANFSWKKIARLYGITLFYTATIGIVFYFTKFPCVLKYGVQSTGHSFNPELTNCGKMDFIKAIIPLVFGGNWFILCYIIFFIFVPFLNKFLSIINQKQHRFLAIFTFFLAAVFPMIPYCAIGLQCNDRLFLFFAAFFISSYIKLYGIKFFENKKRTAILAILAFFLLFFIRMIIFYMIATKKFPSFVTSFSLYPSIIVDPFSAMNSLPVFGLGILILYAFKNLEIKPSKIINAIGGTTMAIYVLHENDLMKNTLWLKFLKVENYFNASPFSFLAHLLEMVLLAFTIFACIEILRKNLFKLTKIFISKKTANNCLR